MTACSLQSAAVDEPLAGTAPEALTWIIVENRGSWGREALAESDLPTPVRELLLAAKKRGVGVLLARHPDRTERSGATGTNVWVARTAVGGVRLRHAVLEDIDVIATWDVDALADGALPALGTSVNEPLLLICTHSKRDQCCAVHGRALIGGLLDRVTPEARARVWECSHVGGHRFAPVTVSLPSGTVHGRLTSDQALALVDRPGYVLPDHMRGRSCFPAPLQAADVAVRRAAGLDGCDDLDVLAVRDDRATPVGLGWPVPTGPTVVEVRHVDGRAWRVGISHETGAHPRSESCGAEPGPVHSWIATSVDAVSPWA